MMRSWLFLTLVFVNSIALAEEPLTIHSFLMSAKDDYHVKNHKELMDYYKQAPKSTPYLNRVEFRTETESFDFYRQKYQIRLYPKGWGETSQNRNLYDATNRVYEIEQQELFSAALMNRYGIVLNYLRDKSLAKIIKALLEVQNDRLYVYRKKSTALNNFDVQEITKADADYVELELDLIALEDSLINAERKVHEHIRKNVLISFEDSKILSVDDIKKQVIASHSTQIDIQNFLKEDQGKIRLAEAKYRLEIAKERDYFNFFVLEFDTQDREEPRRAFSIGFAIKLPFIHPDRDDVLRRKIDVLEEKVKYEEAKMKFRERLFTLSRHVLRHIEQYHVLKKRQEHSEANVSLKQFLQMDGVDPLTVLEIKESVLKGEIRLAKLNSTIRSEYIELMYLLGKFAQKPLKNYLEL